MPPSPIDSSRLKLAAVADGLDDAYGPRRWRRHGPPLDELISTVLSQHTSDTNTARAFRSLKGAFPTWEAVRVAPTAAVAEAIRSGGLAQMKAPRIQAILDAILAERGALNLDHLDEMPLPEAKRWLLKLHGVGPKTAACVLLFSLGKPALPVDTHVHRVAKRIGLIGSTIGADAAHDALETGLGGDTARVYSFHLNAIAHGRAVCTARRPRCARCPVREFCDYYRTNPDLAVEPPPTGGPPPA